MARHSGSRVASHLRWTWACWRSAHPLLLVALTGVAWLLWSTIRESAPGWWVFSLDQPLQLEPWVLAAATGFLLAAVQDGAGRTDPSLGYLATRSVSRRAMLIRSSAMPLLAGAVFFLAWFPARDYLENRRNWGGRTDTLSVSFGLTFAESRRMAAIASSRVDAYQHAGVRVLSWAYERWLIHPEVHEEARRRYRRALAAGKYDARQRVWRGNFEAGFNDYRKWRAGRGPFTGALYRAWWLAILPFNAHWIMWGAWFLSFAAGVFIRAALVFGPASGTVGGLRRLLTPRHLVPVGIAIVLCWGRLAPFLPKVDRLVGAASVRSAVSFTYLHGLPVLLALLVAAACASAGLLRAWQRRDLA